MILVAAPANDSPGDAATQPHSGQCSDDWDGDVNTHTYLSRRCSNTAYLSPTVASVLMTGMEMLTPLPTCPGDAATQLTSAQQWPVF